MPSTVSMPTHTKSPFVMAQRECCNWIAKRCVWRPLASPACILEDPGQRCPPFERVVLPLADEFPEAYGEIPNVYWLAAVKAGWADATLVAEKISGLRRCECGTALSKGKQFCSRCLRQRKRLQNRERNTRFRTNAKSGFSAP